MLQLRDECMTSMQLRMQRSMPITGDHCEEPATRGGRRCLSAKQALAVQAADWPNRISLKGDVRYRHQQTDDESASAKREEDLLRARLARQDKSTSVRSLALVQLWARSSGVNESIPMFEEKS